MKTTRNTRNRHQDIDVVRYESKKIEKGIYDAHNENMQSIARGSAFDLGMKNKPEPECDNAEIYCSSIRNKYRRLGADVKKDLQAKLEPEHLVREQAKLEKQQRRIDNEHREAKDETYCAATKLNSHGTNEIKKEKRYKKMMPWQFFLTGIDVLVNGSIFMVMGYSLITSYLIGLAIGLCVYFLAENFRTIIEIGSTKTKRRIIGASIFILLFIVFLVLGKLRIAGDVSGMLGIGASPLMFAALNMLFASVAIIICYFNKPTKQERKAITAYKKQAQKLADCQGKENRLRGEVDRIEDEMEHRALSRKQLMLYAEDLQDLIDSLYQEAMSAFISTNLATRNDGQIPKFFNKPIPSLRDKSTRDTEDSDSNNFLTAI